MIKKYFSLIYIAPILAFNLVSCSTPEDSRKIEKNQKIFFNFPIVSENKIISNTTQDSLNKKLNNRMLFGPEAMILKKIKIFNDKNSNIREALFSEKESIIYINLNIAFKNKILNDYDLAEYIFQLVSHEYKHFQAETYLNNIQDKDLTTSNIFLNGKEQKWPKVYIDKFKGLLNYNLNSPKYTKQEVKKGFVSLGSVYNQKELFDIANSKSSLFKLNGNEVMAPLKPEVPVDEKHIIKSYALKYIFSMEELYARKNQLALESIFPTKNNKYGLDSNGWFLNDEKKFWSPYLQDVINFRRNLNTNEGEYLKDNPLGSNRENLIKLFKESISYDVNGLTLLQFENKESEISIGGKSDIEFKPRKLIAKNLNNESSYILETISKNKNYWIAKNILANSIINKNLYLENSEGKRFLISKTRNSNYGSPSTFKFTNKNTNNYEAKVLNGKVRIILKNN